MDNTLDGESFRQLLEETCRHSPDSLERRRGLTKIIRMIVQSGKLWREETDYYEDALQKTWIYFCQNLCEATTARSAYDPAMGSVTTWLNAYLKRRLQDGRIQKSEESKKRAFLPQSQDDSQEGMANPLENLAGNPDIPPLLEETYSWAEQDPTGELRQTHVKNRPDITAQILILRRLPPETSWEVLSQDLKASISTLSGFYQRKCLPLLCQFGQSQGYLD